MMGRVMLAMAEVIRAVSLVVKWAMAPPMVQPMGNRAHDDGEEAHDVRVVDGEWIGSDHGEYGVAPDHAGEAHEEENEERGW